MSLNISTQDLENYPGVTKTVNLDLASVVPLGYEGDEKIVLNVGTNAYSDNELRTAIQRSYITGFKSGWCKSSGLTGSGGRFAITSDNNRLKVKVDATISGSDGNGFYEIELESSATPISGDVIADDMQEKIRAIGDDLNPVDSGFELSYKVATVDFKDGKFWIISGSLGNNYTGPYRTSVEVAPADTKDASAILGFDLPTSSLEISTISVKETVLSSGYTAGDGTLSLYPGTAVVPGDCLMITDGTNKDYFTALSGTVTDTSVSVATLAENGYNGIVNDYSTSGTKVQVMREQDPDVKPINCFNSFDDIARRCIQTMMKQIDYSS
jgi:hypothetical protein